MRIFLRWLVRSVINLIAKVEIYGYENVPATGAFIIAANHLGLLDAPLLFYALNRWDVFIPVPEKWAKSALLRGIGQHANFIFIHPFTPHLKCTRKRSTLMA